jgi:hypothetical protein
MKQLPSTTNIIHNYTNLSREGRKKIRGLALREVLVIGVFATLLLMLLVMWIGGRRGASRRDHCTFRQQQTAAALLQHEAMHGHFPGYRTLQAIADDGTPRAASWVFPVLPYLGYRPPPGSLRTANFRALAEDPAIARPYAPLWKRYGPAGPDDMRGEQPSERIVELLCPDDPTRRVASPVNRLSFVVNTGMPDVEEWQTGMSAPAADWNANGVFMNQFDDGVAEQPYVSLAWIEAHNGANTTLLLSENVDAGQWTDTDEALVGFVWVAEELNSQPSRGSALWGVNERTGDGDGSIKFARPSSFHPGGVNVVYASGETQFMDQNIDWLVFARLMTPDGAAAKFPGSEEPVPEAYR